MPTRLFCVAQVMNVVAVALCLLVCLHMSSFHTRAEPETGALTVVPQEDENGVTLEIENGDEAEQADQVETDPFHPTHEWQTIKQGQKIPAGLHVRMNFETGEKEAKLMDGDTEFKYWRDGDRQGMMNMDRKQFSMNELKRALKDFKTTQLDDTDLKREDDVKKKFKSYDELKKEFHNMNMDIKTDGEVIEEMIDKLKDKDINRDNLLTVLTDLEYYLHQIDNGVLFKDWGGIPLILKILNQTNDEELQQAAALVLGSATSSNPKVQIGALEAGALQLLLRLLSTQSSLNVRRKILYCIATLCRHFPYAQIKFLELGGLAAIGDIFNEDGTDQLRIKVIAFLNDLLMEKKLTEENINMDRSSDLEKMRQYNQVPLLEAMMEHGWCDRIPSLLQLSDHDSREHVLTAMQTLVDSCKPKFRQSRDKLDKLKLEYVQLAHEEDDGDYFRNLVSVIDKLLQNVGAKDEL